MLPSRRLGSHTDGLSTFSRALLGIMLVEVSVGKGLEFHPKGAALEGLAVCGHQEASCSDDAWQKQRTP